MALSSGEADGSPVVEGVRNVETATKSTVKADTTSILCNSRKRQANIYFPSDILIIEYNELLIANAQAGVLITINLSADKKVLINAKIALKQQNRGFPRWYLAFIDFLK